MGARLTPIAVEGAGATELEEELAVEELAQEGEEDEEAVEFEELEAEGLEEEGAEEAEAALDEILRQQFQPELADGAEEQEPGEEETPGPSPLAEERILPVQPDEFVCQQCFLIKHRTQLADPSSRVCHDCVLNHWRDHV